MDEAGIAKKGLSPIQPELDRIADVKEKAQLAHVVARMQLSGMAAFFSVNATPDAKDATQMILNISQGGLGLPDRDFYLQTDPKSVETREKYLGHARRMFELLGHTPERAKAEADAVLQIETALAQVALDRVSLRDPNKRYHKVPVAELGKLTPDFDWKSYLTDLGVSVSSLNGGAPDFMKGLEATLTSASLDDLKTYPTWHVLRATAPMLPKRFSDESFAFFGKTLTGAKEEPARWKRCVLATERDLGEIVGQKYVEQTFGQEGKERTLCMVTEIEKEMAKDIDSLNWMSDETKQQALAKLKAVANKIGYPEQSEVSELRAAR